MPCKRFPSTFISQEGTKTKTSAGHVDTRLAEVRCLKRHVPSRLDPCHVFNMHNQPGCSHDEEMLRLTNNGGASDGTLFPWRMWPQRLN